MKKVLFSIAASLALFACSSDQPGLPGVEEGGKYPVTFNVSAFSESTSPLKAIATTPGTDQKAAFTYAIYKATGEFVKTNTLTAPYASPAVTFNDELEPGAYKVAFAMQYVQDGQAFPQPNLNVAFNNATFEYSPSSDCFFKTADLTVTTNGGNLSSVALPRVTGAAEIYITNIEAICNMDAGTTDKIKIGAFNIPNAFKISDPTQVISTTPNQFEKEFTVVYYHVNGDFYYYKKGTPSSERAFPAVFSGGWSQGVGNEGGEIRETFYRYIHTMPTTAMIFKITKGAEVKTISNFEVKSNQLTKLKGSFSGQNNIDVSVDTSWGQVLEETF
ncbi:MAG: hypothetical protein E6772_18300 [Dysgonomonas sp.]|nr:hypothetical protein [Dysgonomonas sp.]